MSTASVEEVTYVAGLGLGQAQQFSALAVLERAADWGPARYAVRHLERWPPGTPYAAIFGRVIEAFTVPPLAGGTLVVDRTGVGGPVVEALYRAGPRAALVELAVSSGAGAALGPGGWLVPRRELVGVMQLLLQGRRLLVSPALPDAQLLLRELAAFKARATAVSETAVEAWRDGEHDDLVLAVASAAWWAECGPRAGAMW